MSMVIAHNMSAINTKRQFSSSARGMSGAMEKLSSGYKINTGEDDPSGLVISERLRSQINGITRALQNTTEAKNVLSIAEGALNEMNSMLTKMKELAIHSSNNGITSPDQIAADQSEMDSMIQAMNRIAETTSFGGQKLLDGRNDIGFKQDTLIKGTQNNSLLNTRESDFGQIFKRDMKVSINFTGSANADAATGIGDVDFSQQAMKAYLEVDTAKGAFPKPDIDDKGAFTKDLSFTLTGNKGSRSFKFKAGAAVTDLVSQIKSSADSTGIDASLVFNSDQTIAKASGAAALTSGVQLVSLDGLKGKNGKNAYLELVGTVGSGADYLADKYDISVTSEVTTSGAIAFRVSYIDPDTNTMHTVSGAGPGGVWDGRSDLSITSGALAGVTIRGTFREKVDFAASFKDAVQFASGTGAVSGSVIGTVGGVAGGSVTLSSGANRDNFSSKLIDASDVKLTIGKGTLKSGAGTASSVTLTGIGSDGKAFSMTGSISSFSSGSATIKVGGMEFDVAMGNTSFSGTFQKTIVALDFTYETKSAASLDGTVQKNQVNGKGQATYSSVGGISMTSGTSGVSVAREAGDVAVFNNTISNNGNGVVLKGVNGLEFNPGGADSVQFGMNTDGQGRIYVKFLDDNSFELYKDASLSEASKVATGINGEEIKEYNNSGLKGMTLYLAGSDLASKTGVYLAFAGIEGESYNKDGVTKGVSYDGSVVGSAPTSGWDGGAIFDASRTLITGVELGKNTSDEGQIYLKNVYDHDNGTVQVFAYKHKDMRDEDLVAKSEIYNTRQLASGYDASLPVSSGNQKWTYASSMTVVLNEVRNADNTAGTGLGMVLSVEGTAFEDQSKSQTLTGKMTFNNLGARIYAQDYGENGFIKLTQDKGAIFYEYGTAGDNSSKRLLDAGTDGVEATVKGQDATLAVNGTQVKTDGLKLNMSTQDIQANLTFHGGKVGSTTLAQVGYGDGSLFTKIGALNLGSTQANEDGLSGLLCNAGHVTTENIGNFSDGMQLQLDESSGDQSRTIIGLKSMTADNVGRITKGGYWETGSAVWTEKQFTLKDVMGGGLASLSQRPTLAMEIIDQAISDVSENRAKIGAVQANLLQTNANNLEVTMENLQKTESGIRDADMADEMTEFTKQQVLQNAAMSMMSQANQASQNVLQLLR